MSRASRSSRCSSTLDIDRAEALREENDPEVIMTDPAQPRFIAHRKALDSSTRSEP
jgi:hypothetical protein